MKETKFFGHEAGHREDASPIELAQVSLVGSPSVLRDLARFLNKCADELDASPKAFAHAHFRDFERANRTSTVDFIVVSPSEYSSLAKHR